MSAEHEAVAAAERITQCAEERKDPVIFLRTTLPIFDTLHHILALEQEGRELLEKYFPRKKLTGPSHDSISAILLGRLEKASDEIDGGKSFFLRESEINSLNGIVMEYIRAGRGNDKRDAEKLFRTLITFNIDFESSGGRSELFRDFLRSTQG